MNQVKMTRRSVGKILALAGAGTPVAAMAKSNPASLMIETPRVEWQVTPLAIGTTRPRFTWTLKAARRGRRGLSQSAFRLTVMEDGSSALLHDTGKVTTRSLRYRPEHPLILRDQGKYRWTLQVWDQDDQPSIISTQTFMTGLVTDAKPVAKWIAGEPDKDDRFRGLEGRWRTLEASAPVPEFDKALEIETPPILAHLIIACGGQYHLSLDGRRLSPDAMNGHWTNFAKRVAYDGYDLTGLLKAGEHRVHIQLGNGFFNVESVKDRYSKLNARFGQPQVWAQIHLTYPDGSHQIIGTDSSWRVRESATVYSSIYGGEDFDARRNAPWHPAIEVAGPTGQLEASRFVPMKVRRRLMAKSVTHPAEAIRVYDFGLNHSGKPLLRLNNTRAGETLSLYPSELLDAKGLIDTQSMGAKPKTIGFTYICRGAAEEVWTPGFTYTGYRYLQVEGALDRLTSVESLFLYNDLPEVGQFSSTDRNLEQIHALIKQALLSNFASVLTDCPHREKLGWLEQIYLNAETAMMNTDAIPVYEKMMADIRDSQTPEGMIPAITPEYVAFVDKAGNNTPFRDSPEWAAALIMAAWYAYRLYGDLSILEDNYAAMTAYIAFIETRLGPDGLLDYGLGDWFDIGPKKPGKAQLTSKKMTGTATLVSELRTLGQIARRLGRPEADLFDRKAAQLKTNMQARLFDPVTSRFDTGSQCAQAMAIVVDLLPDGHKQRALQVLIDDIRSRNDHVSAGDIGFHYVVRALSDNGHADLLHAMLSRRDKPAYLQQIDNGATALTEAWDSARHASQNHFMLGHAEIWFWQGLGGIRLDFSSEVPLILAPQLVPSIAGTSVVYQSVLGEIESRLMRKGNRLIVLARVPVGSTAVVRVPGIRNIRESGSHLKIGNGITDIKITDQETWITVGSGEYRFSTQI